MKIGIVTTWFERGAAYVSKQFEDVLSIDHSVFIYARGGEKYGKSDPKWNKNNVTWGKKVETPLATTLIRKKDFEKWILTHQIEAVIFNEQHWWPPIVWCNEMGVKTIAYIDYYTERTIPLFAAYDSLICNTKKHFSAFNWHQGAVYVPWGTDTNVFTPSEVGSEIINSGKIRLFHSCGMNPKRKGTDLLLKSLEKLKSKNYELIIHSQVPISQFFPELSDLINNYSKEGKLQIITKTVSEPGLYFMGDIYVYPSRLEGIGLTVPEAISSGLGVIVPNCGPMNEFVQNDFGKTVEIKTFFARSDGYYWPQNEVSIDALANCIDELLSKPKEIASMKTLARDYAIRMLNWEINSEQLKSTIIALKDKEKNTISKNVLDKIRVYENSGVKRFNNLAMKLSWLYLLIKRSNKNG